MTINTVIENQIVKHNTVNGKTNSEMYRTANRVCYDTYWFSERGLATKGNPFTKANNYTVAYLDHAESGEIDHWIKIDNMWYYVTKEQLTNLFDHFYEETDGEFDDYIKDNIIEEDNENDTNVKMMADIIYFVKNGPDCNNKFYENPAIGVGISIIKDWDFFEVIVYSLDGQYEYMDSFWVEIDDFTEVFDFIWNSIDNIVVTA